jgi:hypothetical protein
MTPKEKAEQLIRKYYSFGINKEGQTLSWDESKQCALIAVDEIINNSLEYMGCDLNDGEIIYWQEVKQEIEKL